MTLHTDIGVEVRPMGGEVGSGPLTLDRALARAQSASVMDGDNKVGCERCGERTRSVKGERLVSVAPHLAFHLHRFTLDLTTLTSKKVLDELRFPFWVFVDA